MVDDTEDLFTRLLEAAEQVRHGGEHRLTKDGQGRQRLTHSSFVDDDGAGLQKTMDNDDAKPNASDLSWFRKACLIAVPMTALVVNILIVTWS